MATETSSPSRCLDWSRVQSVAGLEASRAFRFRPEERGALLDYLGIRGDSFAAEVGCGPGVLAKHLAARMPGGLLLGVDITPEFISFAGTNRRKQPNVAFVQGDAYALPIEDGVLDAVTSYTLLAILQDPAEALREQMRVTKKGGVVSGIEVVRSGISFAGRPRAALPAEKAQRLSSLREERDRITQEFLLPLEKEKHGFGWSGQVAELPLLFESVGLKDVRLRGFSSIFSTSDETYTVEERRWFLHQIGEEELAAVDQLWEDWREVCVKNGLSDGDQIELRRLIVEENEMRLRDFDEGHHAWAWHGTMNLVAAGKV